MPTPTIERTGSRHMAVTKRFLTRLLIEKPEAIKDVLVDWTGTVEDAIQKIMDDPRDVFAMDCDHYDEKGHCLGHAK